MLTNTLLQKLSLPQIIDEVEDKYLELRNRLRDIERSKDDDVTKNLHAIKLVRMWFAKGGKI